MAAAAAKETNLARLAVAAGASPLSGLTENEVALRDGRLVAASTAVCAISRSRPSSSATA